MKKKRTMLEVVLAVAIVVIVILYLASGFTLLMMGVEG